MTDHLDPISYAQLETGARFLASRASTAAERDLHLAMANKYARQSSADAIGPLA